MEWRRLVADKKDVDYEPGYVWKTNTKKIALWSILIAVTLFLAYAFMRSDTYDFLRQILVYAVVGLVIFSVFVLIAGFTTAAYSKIKGYLIALVFIFATYLVLSYIMNITFSMKFNYGYGAWVLMLTLAGFHRIDGKLDSRDFFYAIFVITAIIFANMPFGVGGRSVLDVFTIIVNKIFSLIGILKSNIQWSGNFSAIR